MKLIPSLLSVLVLLAALPVRDAHGAIIIGSKTKKDAKNKYTLTVVVDNDPEVASVALEVRSDGGDEDLLLTESDARLHGAASISGLPKADASIALTLYDAGNASLVTFTGTLGADGSVTLEAKDAGGLVCDKSGCTSIEAWDIELAAADVFAAAKGYDVAFDLAGADVYEIAYGELTLTEACADAARTCTATTKAEVDWDALAAVWEGEVTLEHYGLIDVTAETSDASGKKLDSAKVEIGVPWLDDGEGVTTLATDSLTTVALHKGLVGSWNFDDTHALDLSIQSRGWASGGTLPAHAELALTNGRTLTVPANSYQRSYKKLSFEGGSPIGRTYTITVGGAVLANVSATDLASPLCTEGVCATLVRDTDGGYGLALTTYAADASKLPEALDAVVVDDLDDTIVAEERVTTLDDTITAVFATELEFSEDPTGRLLEGEVRLLGAAKKGGASGKQDLLVIGIFYGRFARDGDGDLSLAAVDRRGIIPFTLPAWSDATGHYHAYTDHTGDEASAGEIVVPGETVGLIDREGNPLPPPTIQYGNGSGTKAAASQTSAKPQLL